MSLCGLALPPVLGHRSLALDPRPSAPARSGAVPRLRFLASDPRFVYSRPCFSPEGDRILFMRAPATEDPIAAESSDRSPWSLRIMPVDGRGEATLFFEDPELRATRPEWSGESGRIAFTGIRGRSAELWLIDADGRNLVRIPVGDPPADRIFYPSWFPDGKSVAVTHWGNHQVLQVDVFGGGVQALTDPSEILAGMCSVSPNGGRENPIAFAGQRPSGRYSPQDNTIWLQYPGARPYQLDGKQGRMPQWSPSEDLISFASLRGREAPTHTLHRRSLPAGRVAIFVESPRRPDETSYRARAVSPVDHLAWYAKWSPDGKKLVCMAAAARGGQRGIAVIDLAEAI